MVTFEPVTLAPGVRFPDRELLFGKRIRTILLLLIAFPPCRAYTLLQWLDPLRGASEKIGTIQRRLAWPLRKDDTHTSRMYHFFDKTFCSCLYPFVGVASCCQRVHTWMGASSDHQDSSPSGKLLHCTPEFNEPLRGSPSGLPTFSFLSEKCGVRAHFYTKATSCC